MESPRFKDPQPPEESVSDTSNSVINTERSETPDSNKGLQDNDSVTNSPKISKPVLGKAQAKKRLMAFVNKFNAAPKIQKSTDKNEISTRDPNSIKKKSIENTGGFKGSSKQLDRKMEDCSDLLDIEHQPGKKMKKRSEQKVLAIDEIIREDARHKEWLAKNTSENQLLLERMTKDGYARNRDRDRYSDRRSRNDQRRRKPRFDNRRDHDRRNWRGSNNQRSRRQSPTDKRGNSSLDQNMPSRKISLERSGVIDQKISDKKRPQSSERRDEIRIKDKKDQKIGNERCRSKSNDADKQSKFKDDSKFSTKSQNEKTRDNSQTNIHTKSCNNWRDFKNGGGFVRGKSLSIEPPKLPGKDLKSKTAQEYDMYLKQMLITDNNRLERSLVVANATVDGQQKEYPPESIRVTKNSKIVPIFYCGNPNISLFMSRREVLGNLPPERCKTIRAIAENTQNPSTSQVEVEPKYRVWFERLKLTKEEEELPKKNSPTESPTPRKSRWDNGDETASKPVDEILPKELENIPTKSVSPGITLETRILTPSTDNKEEENIPLVEKFDQLAEENTVKTNENLASEYEQFMKIVTNDTSTVATLDDCYSSDESTSKTPPPSPSQAEYHQNLTPSKLEKSTPMEFDSIDYLVDDKSLDETKKIDESFLKKPETVAVVMDKTIEVSQKNEKEDIEIQLPLGNIVIKNERLSDEAISNSEETINIRKLKKKIASSSESSDSSSTSLSENEVRRKKLKRRRRKKRTKESSTMSSSSSSDSSSDEMNSRKRRKVRRKKKNKRSKLSKKRSRRDSSFSDSSNTSLENNLKRRKITAAKHSKISEERRSQSMENFQLRKIKKEKEDIVEIVKENIEVPAEVTIKTVVVPSEVKEIVEQVDIKDENNDAVKQRVNEIQLEKVEEDREIVKNLDDKSDDTEIENTDVEKLDVEVPAIMEEKQEQHEMKKITNIKEELPEIPSTVEITTNESEQHEKTGDSVEKLLEKPSDEIVQDEQETIQIQKSDSRRRRHSTSSSSSSFTSSSVDSTSTLTSENTRSSSKSRRKRNKGQKASRHRRSKPKKLMKNNDKWGSQLDFDSLHSLNFPSLTQLEQRVGKNLDDWEVDSMDGVREFAASTSRDKSKRSKKVEKEVRYDEKTDTYISVEKETPRGSKKKIPDRKCSLRIWEDEEEEGEREAILLLKGKDENSEENLQNWLPGGERFPQVSKIEIKKKEESIMIQPEISPKKEKTESSVWMEVHPDAIPLPESSASKGKIKKSRWSNVTSPILESPKTPDTPEGSLVPVNWEEEEVVWPEPIKSQDIKQSRSKLDIDKLVVKKLESNVEIDKHDSINTEGSSVYSATSPTLSQKLDTAEPSSDSSSDSSDSSSTSESSDSDGDSANEESPKSDDVGSVMNTYSPENNSRISFTKEDSKDFLMKDTDDDLEYSESDTMKKLRMNMFHQFSGKSSDKLTPVELNNAVKSSADSLSPKSTLKLIPNMLLARRPVDVLSRSPQFKLDRFPSTQSTDLGEQFDIPTSDSSTSVPKLENQENSSQKQVFRNTFTEITSQDSRSSLSEQRRRLSPRRDREESRKSMNQDRGISSNYPSIALSIPKDLDRDKGKFESRESRPGRSSPRDRRRFSPDDRKFQRRSPPPRYRGRSRSASRSWSRSRSRSPRRDGKWDRQKRCRYSDEGRDKFSRSPGRGRLFGLKDRTPDKKSPEIKPYDPMEMLRNAASSKQRENEAAERARRLEESNIIRDESVTLDNLYSTRIKPDIGVGSVFDERPYPRDSLEREIIEGPTTSTFDGPSRPRYRSRSLERRNRDGDWDRSRESSVSDRLRRERRSSPNRRSKPSRLLSPPRRGSPLRKRFISRSRSRSWSKSRSSSRSRSRSRSISRPRLRSRSPSPSRSRIRLRAPERRRSLDRFRRSRSRSITRSRTRSRSRSYSPRRRRSRSLERFPERITSGETGRRIETIVHPSGMNPPPPEVTSDPLSRDSNVTAPFHYPTERVGDYPYYPRNNLTYPPRMEEAALNTGSPKRLSLDDRLELELGIKKSQEGGLPFNRPNFNPHMMVFPSPPPGIAPVRGAAPIVPPLGHIPPIRRNQPTVLQVGNVLQVVPADFNGPVVPQAIRNETPSSSPNASNANRVVRVGNVLQVVPTTNVDWTGSGTPIIAPIDRLPSVQYPPPSPSTLAVNPAVPIITSVPIPTAVPAPSIIPSSPRTMALPLPTIPLLSPAVVPPEIKPVQAPPPIPFAVYNYDAIMETRRKEKEERKKLRDERRREKERRKMEKIRRRTKRIMGRTGRVQVLAEQDLALELNTDVSTVIAEEIQKIIVNNEEDESKTVNEIESVVAPEVDDDEDDEEDEEGEVEEDEENGEEEPEEETPEPVETEENCEDESQKVVLNCGEQIDIENPETIESTSGVDVENISASVSAIVIQPTPKKGILVAPGLWDKKLLNGDSDDGDFNHVENADDDSLLSNDNFMVGWDIDEDKDDLENGRERNMRTPRRNRSKKAVQFADGVKPGEGTSPSGGEGDMPSPPPPASTSDQDPMEEFGKRTRNRKDSRKKGKRAKPPKTKKKVKVKIIKLKKPKITPLTAAMLDDSDEVDDRSPPPPPPGSPPPPELWPDYLSTYNPATAQSTEVKSPSPSTSQEAPPPTPLPLLVPPPPLNYTIQPCNKA